VPPGLKTLYTNIAIGLDGEKCKLENWAEKLATNGRKFKKRGSFGAPRA